MAYWGLNLQRSNSNLGLAYLGLNLQRSNSNLGLAYWDLNPQRPKSILGLAYWDLNSQRPNSNLATAVGWSKILYKCLTFDCTVMISLITRGVRCQHFAKIVTFFDWWLFNPPNSQGDLVWDTCKISK